MICLEIKSPLHLVFDGDMIVYQSCVSVEQEVNWEGDLWLLWADAADAKGEVDERISGIVNAVLDKLNYEGDYDIILCFTCDTGNFRKRVLPTYKKNRETRRKPVCYHAVKEWAKQNYDSVERPHLEADDLCGILATRYPGHTVIISGDKDFKSIPGIVYNFMKGEVYSIDAPQADYFHLLQTLVGDTADNYSGCPGIGIKTAEKLFAEKGVSWKTVVDAFRKKGLTEEYALQQARVAYILRDRDYDEKTGNIKLWIPPV